MKRIFLVLALLSGLCVRAAAPLDTEKIWNDANTAYVNADYPAATEGYERLLGEGYESAQLYLNLGNAYFKRGMNGRAILNYRKALRLCSGRRGYPLQPVDRRSPHAGSYRVGSRLFRQAVDRVARTFRREQHVGRAEPRVFRADAFLHGRVPVVEACFVPKSRILRSARLAVAFRRFGRVRVGRAQGPACIPTRRSS